MDTPIWNEPREIDEMWVQLVGDDVAICSNTEWGDKFIDFVNVRTDRDGDEYIDEDNISDGGMDANEAEDVAAQLLMAAKILRESK